jgi:hypothetical protein
LAAEPAFGTWRNARLPLALAISARFAALHESLCCPFPPKDECRVLSCLADLIINDDGVSACDASYVCFLCSATANYSCGEAISERDVHASDIVIADKVPSAPARVLCSGWCV